MWNGEVHDSLKESFGGPDAASGDFKASNFHSALCKYEFFWVECDTIFTTQVEPFACLVEACLPRVCSSILLFLFGKSEAISSNPLQYPSPGAMYPCRAVQYRYLPQRVIKVVRCLSS